MKTPLPVLSILALAACQPGAADLIATAPATEAPATTARITPDGGEYALGDGLILRVAPGAVEAPVDVSVSTAPAPEGLDAISDLFRLEPEGLEFLAEVSLVVPVDAEHSDARAFSSNGHGGFFQPGQIQEPGAIDVDLPVLTQIVVAPNQAVEEITVIVPPAKVDVLFVIDNSCSMANVQAMLAAEPDHMFGYFVGSGIDYHIGATSTDMDNPAQSGTLRSIDNAAWIDPTTPDPMAWFGAAAAMGTNGAMEERGLDAAWTALEVRRNGVNAGFWRDDAELHMVFVSNEDDQSNDVDKYDFVDWLDTVKPSGEVATAHSITFRPNTSWCPNADSEGWQYRHVVDHSGGLALDLCAQDWGAHMDDIGFEATGWERDYLLQHDADPTTIEIEADFDGGTTTYDPSDWSHDPATRIVTFTGVEVPPPGAVVRLSYLPL